MLMALVCVCVALRDQMLSRRADSECVHTEPETGFRFRVSALILLQAFQVFLSHSLSLSSLSLSDYCHSVSREKKQTQHY